MGGEKMKYLLRLDKELHKALSDEAWRKRISMNALILERIGGENGKAETIAGTKKDTNENRGK
jgi:predicted HicB family RNase H-like nuclease